MTFGGLLLLGGRIADYVGRKRILLVGLLGFAGASALGGLAPNASLLFAARALQGAFAALMAPAALSLVTVTFTEARERARAFGVWGAIAGGGLAIGLVLGGVLTQYASWRWCLLVNTPIALLAGAAAVRLIPESRVTRPHPLRHPRRPDLDPRHGDPGLRRHQGVDRRLGIARRPSGCWPWPVALLVAFVVIERFSSHPLLPLAGRHGPQPGRLVPDDAAGRAGHVRDLPLPDLLPAGRPALLGRSRPDSPTCPSRWAWSAARRCPAS